MNPDIRKSLIEKKEKLVKDGQTPESDLDPMQQYNHVVTCFQLEENRVGDYVLQKMTESITYRKYWMILCSPVLILVFQFLILLPFVGCLLYLWQLFAIVLYFKGLNVFHANKREVADPFQNMIFCPEICRLTNSINKFYEIQVQDLPGFVFNVDVMKNLKMKEFQGRIKFMLYNGKFWDYYYDYPKLKGRHILAFLLGTLILSAQVIIDVFIIHLTRDH